MNDAVVKAARVTSERLAQGMVDQAVLAALAPSLAAAELGIYEELLQTEQQQHQHQQEQGEEQREGADEQEGGEQGQEEGISGRRLEGSDEEAASNSTAPSSAPSASASSSPPSAAPSASASASAPASASSPACVDQEEVVEKAAKHSCSQLAALGACSSYLCPQCLYAGYCDASCDYCDANSDANADADSNADTDRSGSDGDVDEGGSSSSSSSLGSVAAANGALLRGEVPVVYYGVGGAGGSLGAGFASWASPLKVVARAALQSAG